MRLQSTFFFVAVVFGGNSLVAQSQPGLTYDSYMRTGGVSDTVTNVVHVNATANAMRMEFEKRPTSGAYRSLPVGDHGVLIVRSSGAELVMIDPDKKQYISIKPLEMASGARQMMESMGGSMTFDTASSVHVDSLGPGPTIDGHNTLRYRLAVHTKIHIAMGGQDQTVENQSVLETENAVDLDDLKLSHIVGTGGLRDTMQSLAQTVGLPKDFLEQATKAGQRVKGFPLHSERHTTSITSRGTLTSSETSDTKNVRRASIPDSTFAVPADYKLMPFPFGQPPPSPDLN